MLPSTLLTRPLVRAVAITVVLAPGARAQSTSPPTSPGASQPTLATGAPSPAPAPQKPASAVQPPVLRFAPEGITLDEVVRLTLQNDPELRRREEDVHFQQGREQEQRGYFDTTLLAGALYDYRVQELTESRKKTEQEKRDNFKTSLSQTQAEIARRTDLTNQLVLVSKLPPGSDQVDKLTELDPRIGAQVQFIDALIANAPPGAQDSLLQARAEYLSTMTSAQVQVLQDLGESADATKRTIENLGAAPQDEVFYNANVNLQISKLFRTGVTFTPYADFAAEGTNYKGKPRDAEHGGKGLQDLYTFHLGANVILPLGRGRGNVAVAGYERAAGIQTEASRLLLDHQASVSALNAVLTYWQLRAEQENLGVAQTSLDLQSKLLEVTRNLIEAGELPSAEVSRSQASEARARAQLFDAQRRVHEARVALATSMGVGVSDDEASLPSARDAFPVLDATTMPSPEIARIATEALARRPDVTATTREVEASQVLEQAAETNLRPRVDLSLRGYYTALAERSVQRAVDRWVGPSGTAGIEFEKPFGNNFFEGQLVQAQATVEQRRIDSADTVRQIRLRIVGAARALPEAIDRVKQAEAAVASYETTYAGELERFRIGESTLLDTVITEQQRSNAQVALILARADLARILATLRYETGTLVVNGTLAPQNLAGLGGVRR